MAPSRTCIACRKTAPRGGGDAPGGLVRLAVVDGVIAVDGRTTAPGRGAWLHSSPACVERAQRESGRIRHALRTEAPLVGGLAEPVRAALRDGVIRALPHAIASGALVSGAHDLSRAVTEGRVLAVVVATDASARSIAALALGNVPLARVGLDRRALGALLHRGPRAAVGAINSTASAALVSQLRALALLG